MVGAIVGAGLGAIGSLAQGYLGYRAAGQAERQQRAAADKGWAAQSAGFDQAEGYQKPYAEGGQQDYQTMRQMVGQNAFGATPYNYQMGEAPKDAGFNFQADPGYQFRMQQGMQAGNAGAAAGGMQLSGGTQKALQRYGQNFASNEYGNAFDRYSQNRQFAQNTYAQNTGLGQSNEMNRYNSANQQGQQRYGQYQDLASIGTTAAGNMSNLATGRGQAAYGYNTDLGNIQSAGTMGRANALGQMFGGLGQVGQQAASDWGARSATPSGGAGQAAGRPEWANGPVIGRF